MRGLRAASGRVPAHRRSRRVGRDAVLQGLLQPPRNRGRATVRAPRGRTGGGLGCAPQGHWRVLAKYATSLSATEARADVRQQFARARGRQRGCSARRWRGGARRPWRAQVGADVAPRGGEGFSAVVADLGRSRGRGGHSPAQPCSFDTLGGERGRGHSPVATAPSESLSRRQRWRGEAHRRAYARTALSLAAQASLRGGQVKLHRHIRARH